MSQKLLLPAPKPPFSSEYMRIKKVRIKNFKAIDECEFNLGDFVVLVGANGSGKSSVLQAMHWSIQSCRNPKINPTISDKTSTLSELNATYMPSPDYKNASHTEEYGNAKNSPQMSVYFESELDNNYFNFTTTWLKSARNEGISVHAPSRDSFITTIKSTQREASAYIPGLAGIPAFEEKRSKRIVQKHAASGDANTVLRNILLLLKEEKVGKQTNLFYVEEFISRVFGGIKLDILFEENNDYKIHANFQTEAMGIHNEKLYKPLELAGIGFLQVIQIFSYIVYFKPRIILIDEPDAHLHPDIQERLVQALYEAAIRFDCQVIMTTHSPNVVRALPLETSVVWMQNGKASTDKEDEIRRSMGWGLLDKKIILITEDKDTRSLNLILEQWPNLKRKCVVWPTLGSSKLPTPQVISSLRSLFDDKMKFIVHRDSDFFLENDKILYAKEYNKAKITVWFTQGSDIEFYFINKKLISKIYNIKQIEAESIINEAINNLKSSKDFKSIFNRKRNEISNNILAYRQGKEACTGAIEAFDILKNESQLYVFVGKDILSQINSILNSKGYKKKLDHATHPDVEIAPDLKELIISSLRK